MTLTIPLIESQRQVFDKNALIKLKVLDVTSTTNSTVTFRLEENHEFLQLDKATGQLWFKQRAWKNESLAQRNVVVTAEKSDGAVARMSLNLKVIPVDDVRSFCENFLCFYESITYHAIEDFNETFKSHEIAELSTKIYGRLCKSFEVNYELLNGKKH